MKNRIKKILMGAGIAVILIAALIIIKDELMYWLFSNSAGQDQQASSCSEGNNVALVKIHGAIVNYKLDSFEDQPEYADTVSSEEIVATLEAIEKDDDIKAIIIEVDSRGGIPSASEEIMNPLKKSAKPVVAVVREAADSGAYLVASAADRIFASKFSDVGSIAITQSYLDNSQQNAYDGLIYQELSTGRFKDTGDPNKALSDEEKNLLMNNLKKMHEVFVKYVAENRNMDIEFVKKLADGSTLTGQDAKDAGLIDEIGDLSSAKEWLREKIGGEAEICEY